MFIKEAFLETSKAPPSIFLCKISKFHRIAVLKTCFLRVFIIYQTFKEIVNLFSCDAGVQPGFKSTPSRNRAKFWRWRHHCDADIIIVTPWKNMKDFKYFAISLKMLNMLLTLSPFIRQNNAKWIFKIFIFVSAVILGAIKIKLKNSLWCCILTHIFFLLNTGENGDPYIIKLRSLSSSRNCYDEPEGTLFSLFGPILFLPHQDNVMDHSWQLAINHICKNKKPCLYLH